MNHYPHHIGDYIKSTVHLRNEEDLTYWRLICHYYDTERPIGKETQTVSKRLRLDNQTVLRILQEFFFEQEDGWHNKRCDEEISWYQQKCARNREVGKLGGRPKKTQMVSRKKRLETVSNPNQNQNQNQELTTLSGKPDAPKLNGNGKLHAEAVEILGILNATAGRNYRPCKANLEMIEARLRDGATPDEMRAVIGKKCEQWLADEKMAEYLRPATLFNRTKFAQYQGELGSGTSDWRQGML